MTELAQEIWTHMRCHLDWCVNKAVAVGSLLQRVRVGLREFLKDPPLVDPPEELCCPISGELMLNPVILVETGHTFERSAIEEWVSKHKGVCPLSNRPLRSGRIITNFAIKSLAHEWADVESGGRIAYSLLKVLILAAVTAFLLVLMGFVGFCASVVAVFLGILILVYAPFTIAMSVAAVLIGMFYTLYFLCVSAPLMTFRNISLAFKFVTRHQ